MGPRGGVGLGVVDFSSGPSALDLGSCGRKGVGELALCLGEGGAGVADGDADELDSSPLFSENGE